MSMEVMVAIHLHATPSEIDRMNDSDLEYWYGVAKAVKEAKSK